MVNQPYKACYAEQLLMSMSRMEGLRVRELIVPLKEWEVWDERRRLVDEVDGVKVVVAAG